jgi:hypothetical protein
MFLALICSMRDIGGFTGSIAYETMLLYVHMPIIRGEPHNLDDL